MNEMQVFSNDKFGKVIIFELRRYIRWVGLYDIQRYYNANWITTYQKDWLTKQYFNNC